MVHGIGDHMTPRQDPVAALLVVGCLLVACRGSDVASAPGSRAAIDTLASGRVVVRNPDVPSFSGELRLEERFRLGTLEGNGPELFGQIVALELGPEGEVYVLDGQASEVRVFGSDGTFRRSFGGQGEGPGEFDGPGGLALDAEETLWILDWGNGRYTGFEPATGQIRREVRRTIAFVMFPWPGAFEGGVRLIDVGLGAAGETALIRLDTAFVPHDTLPLPQPNPEDRIMFRRSSVVVATMPEPFASRPTWALRPHGGIVIGEGAHYRLHRIGFDRDTSMTIELDRERVSTTEAERDSALASFEEMTKGLTGASPDRRPSARSTRPAHGPLFVDDQDRTWVQSVATTAGEPAWDVFGADGRYLARLAIPGTAGRLRLAMRNDRVAVATELGGFPTVIVYDLIDDTGS